MKNQKLIALSRQFDPELENVLTQRDNEIKEKAIKNARHFALKNLPSGEDDSVEPYTSDVKGGYEKLAADAHKHLQAGSQQYEGRLDLESAKEKDAVLGKEIEDIESKIHNKKFELGDYDPKPVYRSLIFVLILTGLIFLGDTAFNALAFQTIGENLLMALIISLVISLCIFLYSHFIPFWIKSETSLFRKRLILIGALLFAIALFIGMAFLRVTYLAKHNVTVNPVIFVVINLFLLIVSGLVSYFMLPTHTEVKTAWTKSKILRIIKKLKEQLEIKKQEKKSLAEWIQQILKYRLRLIQYSNDVVATIHKMYKNRLGDFMSTNLVFRTDKIVPPCYSKPLPKLDINDNIITLNSINRKPS